MTKSEKYIKWLESEIRKANKKRWEYRDFWGEGSAQERTMEEVSYAYRMALAVFRTTKGGK